MSFITFTTTVINMDDDSKSSSATSSSSSSSAASGETFQLNFVSLPPPPSAAVQSSSNFAPSTDIVSLVFGECKPISDVVGTTGDSKSELNGYTYLELPLAVSTEIRRIHRNVNSENKREAQISLTIGKFIMQSHPVIKNLLAANSETAKEWIFTFGSAMRNLACHPAAASYHNRINWTMHIQPYNSELETRLAAMKMLFRSKSDPKKITLYDCMAKNTVKKVVKKKNTAVDGVPGNKKDKTSSNKTSGASR